MTAPPRWLRIDLPDRRQLLFDALIDSTNGGLYCRVAEELRSGEPVVLDLRLPGLADGVRLAGTVRWRRPPSGTGSEGALWGVAVEFAASQWRKRDFLVDLATGMLTRHRVSSRRIPARLAAELYTIGRGDGEAEAAGAARAAPGGGRGQTELPVGQRAFTRDLGRGGVFLAELTGALPPVGTAVTVVLHPPDGLAADGAGSGGGSAERLRYRGQVAWRGQDVDGEGIGIGFLFGTEAERMALDSLVSRIEDRMLAGG